jgi:hypothetical protein
METKPKKDMDTLVSCMNNLLKEGFNKQFKAIKSGLQELSTEQIYQPEEVKVLSFYRFEGESSADDSAILYAIETDDGLRGTLVDSYGTYSDGHISKFMTEVEDIHKKNRKEKF